MTGTLLAMPLAGMTYERQQLGKSGEETAAAELERRGYAVLARRYRTRYGEIDIVASHDGTIVFVEVKARATAEFGTAAEAVTVRKQRRLAAMAVDYLARNQLTDRPCRFDVVAIDGVGEDARVTVYAHAFEVA
jgi:putative endonuclease